jgi:undecaprenyl-diphosphatase
MTAFQSIIFALIQGVTEFLPVSSQAHLILIPALLGWEAHGRFLDVSVHLGTLLAVLCYFYRDLLDLFTKGFLPFFKGTLTQEGRIIVCLAVGTVPAVIIGYVVHKLFGDGLRGLQIIALSSIVFGAVLYIVDKRFPNKKRLSEMTFLEALLIGLFQVLAFLPGASRSGSTITGARLLGFSRVDATRFSFLMSIPVILGAILLETASVFKEEGFAIFTPSLFLGIVVSFLAGLAMIAFLLRYLQRHSYAPFMIYRMLLGVGILIWIFFA